MPSALDQSWMRVALEEACFCLRSDQPSDVPVGAVAVFENAIVARAHNRREVDRDPLAHAEVLAIRQASQLLDREQLHGLTLYVTLEPCPMCAGAIWISRLGRVVFGAWSEKTGACGSLYDFLRDPRLNHRPQVLGGVLQHDCQALLREFFLRQREEA
jgi:tRNA(adenine34) deaminase